MPSPPSRGWLKVYVKRQFQVDKFTFRQRQMGSLLQIGVGSRVLESKRGLNAAGGSARPLSKRYALFKTWLTKKTEGRGRNVRDLHLTGDMMREWKVRTVSNSGAKAGWNTRKGRKKAWANEDREEFIVWSRTANQAVLRAAAQMFQSVARNLLKEKN